MNRYVESERPSRLQVDDKLEFRRLQDRQVSGFSAVEDLTGISADLTIHAHTIGVVTHQAAGFDGLAGGIARRNPIARREGRKLDPPAREEHVTIDEQGIGTVAYKGGEGRLDLAAGTCVENLNFQPERTGGVWYIS